MTWRIIHDPLPPIFIAIMFFWYYILALSFLGCPSSNRKTRTKLWCAICLLYFDLAYCIWLLRGTVLSGAYHGLLNFSYHAEWKFLPTRSPWALGSPAIGLKVSSQLVNATRVALFGLRIIPFQRIRIVVDQCQQRTLAIHSILYCRPWLQPLLWYPAAFLHRAMDQSYGGSPWVLPFSWHWPKRYPFQDPPDWGVRSLPIIFV